MYDGIIIGAGMSGLAAGIRLAYYDKKVCILEKHYRPGGLNSYYRKDSRNFDVGLHAMTNYVPKNTRHAPLTKLLKQLRLKHEDFALSEQVGSSISFPDIELYFTNDFDVLQQEINEKFPLQAENFQRFCNYIKNFNEVDLNLKPVSARKTVSTFITDPLLIEMLFCPLSFYGSARENDMDFDQFVIMFKSIFFEGFSRPQEGVRKIIGVLLEQFKNFGGELQLNSGVKNVNIDKNGTAASVTLESGEKIEADKILSSAGYPETMGFLQSESEKVKPQTGNLSFIEIIYILDRDPATLGIDKTIIFYSDSNQFKYQKPKTMADLSSGVICCSNNFQYDKPLKEGIIRATHIANFNKWKKLSTDEYTLQKNYWKEESLKKISSIVPDFSDRIIFTDMFTPTTIERYTGHIGGAVYGTPDKLKDGRTPVDNLFISGTDQGFLGIVGAMLSGISIANLHLLAD